MKNIKKIYGKDIIIINTVQSLSMISFRVNFFLKKKNFKTLDYIYKFSLANTPYKKLDSKEFLNILIFNQKKIYNFFKINFFLYLGKLFNFYPDYSIKTDNFNILIKIKILKLFTVILMIIMFFYLKKKSILRLKNLRSLVFF